MEFSTFCSTVEQIQVALSAGATHLILEDPCISIRSFCLASGSTERLDTLVAAAKKQAPNVQLSLNVDVLPHMSDLSLIERYIRHAATLGIQRIRVQDPGLGMAIRSWYPEAVCHLATETGNANLQSMAAHAPFFQRQCFGLDTAFGDMQKACETVSSEFEIMVQGPILLQYSQRRFLKGLSPDLAEEGAVFAARDLEYPGRLYRFYDNPHGHFMYLYFDRCLLSCMAELRSLPVHSWLIDGRGESLAYLETALRVYTKAWKDPSLPATAEADALNRLSSRPQRPGFFRANLTDQDRTSPKDASADPLATVLDVIKERSFTVLAHRTFTDQTPLVIVTPEGRSIPLRTPATPTVVNAGELRRFSWQKGVCSNSLIVPA